MVTMWTSSTHSHSQGNDMSQRTWIHYKTKSGATSTRMNSMNYIGKFISNFRDFYNEINAATLTGAIDVVVVEQPDGSFTCSPFHVRFGKLGVLRSREKIVDIEINGEPLDIHMKLGDSGEAFFVEEVYPNEEVIPPHLACSPIPSHAQIETWMKVHDEDKKKYYEWETKSGGEKLKNEAQPVKVFVAETINCEDMAMDKDRARKISLAASEFRPIEKQESKAEKDLSENQKDENRTTRRGDRINSNRGSTRTEVPVTEKNKGSGESNLSSNSSSNSLSQSQFSDGEKQNTKRKRRKKSLPKKNDGSNGSDSSTSSTSNIDSNAMASALEDNHSEYPTMFSICDVIPDDLSKKSSMQVCVPQRLDDDSSYLAHVNSCSNDSLNDLSRIPLSNDPDFHFFSDTELTPGCSIIEEGLRSALVIAPESLEDTMPLLVPESRPCSPIVSDTEIEQRRHEEESASSPSVVSQSWKWGELPSPLPLSRSQQVSSTKMNVSMESTDDEAVKKQQQEEAQKSMLSGMFSFMKKTKHLRHNQTEGIYLSELNSEELDPEVAALYFPHSYRGESKIGEVHREEDAESGNGPSIPHSPNSQSPHTVGCSHDMWCPASKFDVAMSLCGNLETGLSDELFNQFLVSYEAFESNPMMIENPDLVVRIDGKYYNWRTACPLIMSLCIYKKPLPQPVVELLSSEFMPHQSKKDKAKVNETSRSYSSWFNWGRTDSKNKKDQEQDIKTADEVFTCKEDNGYRQASEVMSPEREEEEAEEKEEENEEEKKKEDEKKEEGKKKKEEEREEGYAGFNSSEESEGGPQKKEMKIPIDRRYYQQNDKCRKTLRLTSEQIASLNLQEGANEVVFSVTTAYQGTSRCKCHIYKWRHDDRVVISDIDGTITKSDVLGHILPIVGKDWAQSGVAQLFTKIKNNGYKLLYLSARAIGQARVTRDYLKSIKQGDLSLPDGPLLLNPTSLISAFHREVIEKKPEEFKISCLRDIAALFPPDVKPFYAGYGNRINDVWAYRAVGIPIVRIFTINYKGELKHELTRTFQSSYTNMCHLVNEMFPPPPEELSGDYSNFVFWRDPIPELDLSSVPKPEEPKSSSRSKRVKKS